MNQEAKAEQLARRFSAMSAERRRVFLDKLAAAGIDFGTLPITPFAAPANGVPVSNAQRRLWFAWRLDPTSAAYNVSSALRLEGRLDLDVLVSALNALCERQAALRTTFRELPDGSVIQQLGEPLPLTLARQDYGELPLVEAEARTRLALAAAAQAAFDLEKGPLVRVSLFALPGERHVLDVTMHHIICDGWSMSVAIRELAELYDARRAERQPRLPELPVQYVDYAAWQAALLDSGEGQRQLDYWTRRLGAACPVLDLPTDYPRPSRPSSVGASHRLELGPSQRETLIQLARATRVTLPAVLLGAYQLLMHRYTRQPEVRVGMTLANRQRREVEGLIGFFVSTVVIQSEARAEQRVETYLQAVAARLLEAQAHQDLPFEQLVQALAPQRSSSHNPLFQIDYDHQRDAGSAPASMGGLAVTALSRAATATQFDLSLETREGPERLTATFTFSSELFAPDTIERLAGHWLRLLEAMAADPTRAVGALPLLGPEERRERLLWAGATPPSEGGVERARDLPLELQRGYWWLFERGLERHAQRLAARDSDGSVTYAELAVRAARVAGCLRDHGVAADELVLVLMPRDLRLLDVLLGTLAAGAVYMPLDPSGPLARARAIIEASQPGVIVTVEAMAGAVGDALAALDPAIRPRLLAFERLEPSRRGARLLPLRVHPRCRAYVIHTSGSTGVPKGAMVEHAGMLNSLLAKVACLGLGERDVLAQTARPSFDISIWQLLTPLLCGGRVEILPDEVVIDAAAMIESVEARGVTVLQVVPSMLQAMLELPSRRLSSLRVLIATGEALPPELARRWLEAHPGVRLLNAYGPAECSDDVSLHWVELPEPGARAVPIGRAIERCRVFVSNGVAELAPLGIKGELCVGGLGVGRGYLSDRRLTAERFVPDPFAGEPGARMYRTGDLARWRRDGNLEFIGREDGQVKLRGYRIELGEIEARLLEQRGVQRAAALVRDDGAGPRLVAYVVPEASDAAREDAARFGDELWAALGRVLPDYMVPAQLMLLPELPLTAHGKLDRQRLPVPPPRETEHAEPRDEVERELAAIWASVLGVTRVGIHDNFFELGGHSLLVTRVASRVREALGVDLPLRALFENVSVAALAERVRALREASQQSPETEALLDFLSELERM
jgi:amino acid adenylation domain-containing protein